jgi:hydrogenase maturation protein HypF
MERRLPFTLAEPVLALGGQMKSSITLAFGDLAVTSPHLGDLDNPEAVTLFARMAADLQSLYGVRAERLLTDAHQNYASTIWARQQGRRITPIWHHHAHASALAGEYGAGEYGLSTPMLVFTWDGVGLGQDGALWGGEALLGQPGNWKPVARLRRLTLQGGDAVAREPWRSAAALCWQAGITPPEGLLPPGNMAERAWSAGLLFDAAAALLGLCRQASYEGQGPALLEACAGAVRLAPALPLALNADGVLEADVTALAPMLCDVEVTPAARAQKFHGALVATACAIAQEMRARHGCEHIGLAGGVFQNRLLTEALLTALRAQNFTAYLGEKIPCNDAGLSYGQIIEYGARR